MPRVTQQYRDARRDEIAQAALRCFAQRGFQQTSMADIITETGLSAGAIYGHFDSKQEIVLEVAKNVVGARIGELTEMSGSETMPSPGDVLGVIVRAATSDFHGGRVLVQLWGEAATSAEVRSLIIDSIVTGLQGSLESYLARWAIHTRGLNDADAAAFAAKTSPLILGLGQGYILQSAILPGFDGEAYLAAAAEVLPGG
jgi:TetR/AcrR family transcriptional regulator, transcriptional repressor of aconitase